MPYLLDTHILIWWLMDDPGLPKDVRKIIQESSSVIFVSTASAWEISIKTSLGKLKAPDDLEIQLMKGRMQALPISLRHAILAGQLPRHHTDPFDRMLVAQAQHEGLTLLTHDRRLKAYGRNISVI